MAVDRELTIATMKGRTWLHFEHIGNADAKFRALCGSSIRVSRSEDGRTYLIDCDVPHIRVHVMIRMPDDYPRIYWRGGTNCGGWWEIDGYERGDFPKQPLDSDAFETADAIVAADPSEQGTRNSVDRW